MQISMSYFKNNGQNKQFRHMTAAECRRNSSDLQTKEKNTHA